MMASSSKNILVASSLSLLLSLLTTSNGQLSNAQNQAVINTKKGRVVGSIFRVGGLIQVEEYLGISYAQPPIGDLRWKPSKQNDKWQHENPLQATKFGPNCPQLAIMSDPTASQDKVIGSENCLYMNIYRQHRPSSPDRTLQPVMVFIHGGSWRFSSSDIYRGYAPAVFGGVVVVTFNYRLGALGFMSSDDGMFQGNYALLDQKIALEWVQDNIEYFGGDKNKVTLFGESAGAISTLLQAISPAALQTKDSKQNRLFQRVIVQSGVPQAPLAMQYFGPKMAMSFIKQSPCAILEIDETLECMKNLTANQIVLLQRNIIWSPVVDGSIIEDMPISYLRKKKIDFRGMYDFMLGMNDVDLSSWIFEQVSRVKSLEMLVTYTHNLLQPFHKNTEKVTEIVVGKYLNHSIDQNTDINKWRRIALNITLDFNLLIPTLQFAKVASTDMQSNVYLYKFVQTPSKGLIEAQLATPRDEKQLWVTGARHTEELPYVFGAPFVFMNASQDDRTLSLQMIKYWTNFAKTGNPNGIGLNVNWPKYNSTHGSKYLMFGRKNNHENLVQVRDDFAGDLYQFWTEEVPSIANDRQKVEEREGRLVNVEAISISAIAIGIIVIALLILMTKRPYLRRRISMAFESICYCCQKSYNSSLRQYGENAELVKCEPINLRSYA